MKAKTIKGNSFEELKSSYYECIADGFSPTLAFIFPDVRQDIDAITNFFNDQEIDLFGASTLGEIYEDQIMSEGISGMLLDMDPGYFKIYFEEYELETAPLVSEKIARQAASDFSKPSFIISSSHFEVNYVKFLKGITDVLGEESLVFGGVAGDLVTFVNGVVFTKNKKSDTGALAIAFDSNKIELNGTSICGWNSLGTVKTVTESEGGKILKIDNKPALDLTMKYAGIDKLPDDYFEAIVLVARTLAMQFPREKGDPVTLVGLLNKEDRSMYTHSDIPVGTKVQFAVPPEFDVIDELVKRCVQVKQDTPDPEAVLIFSCGSRQDSIGPLISDEIAGIRNVFGAPAAGFFSNGEMAAAYGGELDIHNNTVVCAVLKEKPG